MKKINNLLIGTNNKGKLKEIRDLLPQKIKTFSLSQYKIKSPKETGLTFEANSILKSKYFLKKTKLICLADDSGLKLICWIKNQEFTLQDGEENLEISIKLLKEFIEN